MSATRTTSRLLALLLGAVVTSGPGCAGSETGGDTDDGGVNNHLGDGAHVDRSAVIDGPADVALDVAPACPSLAATEGSGASCGTGDKGALADNGAVLTIRGNLPEGNTEDWYTFVAQDSVGVATSGCDKLHVTLKLTGNPSQQYVMDIYRGACPTGGDGGVPVADGGAEAGDGGPANAACVGEPVRYDWYTDFTAGDGGAPSGECPCGDPSGTAVICADDTQRFYVRVRRATGLAVTCDEYSLEMSNGKYPGPYP